MADLHRAKRTEAVGRASSGDIDLILVRLQDGRDDERFSAHASSNKYQLSGIGAMDFLLNVGFKQFRERCPFGNSSFCLARDIAGSVDLNALANGLRRGHEALAAADKALSNCGFFLRHDPEPRRDGHTAAIIKPQKVTEDDVFQYALTWLEEASAPGWVTHVRAIHPPASPAMVAALRFLDMKEERECPEFDFNECRWRFTAYKQTGRSAFDGNAEMAHRWFDAMATAFGPGVRLLVESEESVSPFGLHLLKVDPSPRAAILQTSKVAPPAPALVTPFPERFDIAISFAGTERELAEQLADLLRARGVEVFYDNFYPEHLWGKDLVVFFDEIYRKRSRFCVMFVSAEYASRQWTVHERQSAQARALEEKGAEYILPVRLDNTELPGLRPTTGYLSLQEHSIEAVGEMLLRKLAT